MTTPTAPLCPSCGDPLAPTQAPEASMLACARCLGLWLDIKATRLAVTASFSEHTKALVSAIDQRRAPPPLPPRQSGPHVRRCPVCTAALDKRQFAAAFVELDVCPHHGTWFDRHELSTVVRAVATKRAAEAASQRPAAPVDRGPPLLDDEGVSGFAVAVAVLDVLESVFDLADVLSD